MRRVFRYGGNPNCIPLNTHENQPALDSCGMISQRSARQHAELLRNNNSFQITQHHRCACDSQQATLHIRGKDKPCCKTQRPRSGASACVNRRMQTDSHRRRADDQWPRTSKGWRCDRAKDHTLGNAKTLRETMGDFIQRWLILGNGQRLNKLQVSLHPY